MNDLKIVVREQRQLLETLKSEHPDIAEISEAIACCEKLEKLLGDYDQQPSVEKRTFIDRHFDKICSLVSAIVKLITG